MMIMMMMKENLKKPNVEIVLYVVRFVWSLEEGKPKTLRQGNQVDTGTPRQQGNTRRQGGLGFPTQG